MKTLRLGGKAAGAAAAVAAASSGTVHARAPVQVSQSEPRSLSKVVADDEWLVTHLNGEELLFQGFKPAEIDDAVAEVAGLLSGFGRPPTQPRLVITEVVEGEGSSLASETSSEGTCADAVIASTPIMLGCHQPQQQQAAGELGALLHVTSKLLKRPGLQAEVVQCMLEDPEVRDLILGQGGNLDAYLAAVGIHTPGLLPPAAAAAARSTPGGDSYLVEGGGESEENGGAPQEGGDLLNKLVHAVAGAVEQAGSALSKLGNWLRARFIGGPGAEAGKEGQDGAEAPSGGRSVMGKIMVVAVAVIVVLLLRRPIRFAPRSAAA